MGIRNLNNTLRDSLLQEEPFVYAHLVKFEKPIKTLTGRSGRRQDDYVYVTDGSFDIVFDDGLHSKQSILNTLEFFYPLLSKKFLYIIEDVTFDIAQDIKNIALNSNVEVFGELVIISSKHLKWQ